MAITTPVYCTRGDVKRATDSKETARNNDIVDRAIEAAARDIDSLTHRTFYPQYATRYFDWPNAQRARPGRLWLDANGLISATAVTSGGVTISPADYFLEPANSGPPYSRLDIDLGSSSAFTTGSTHQRSIGITGLWGDTAGTSAAGAIAEALDSAETEVQVTDVSGIGVGSILLVGTEYMIVSEKASLTSGQTVQTSNLTALASNDSVAVTTGTSFAVGEIITVDSERMLIVDITGNTLIVKRAWDGSTLAAHNTGTTIYAPRSLTVIRGALGSTAATHDTAAAVRTHRVPSLVRALNVAEASVAVAADQSGHMSPKDLSDLRDRVYAAHGRKARMRAV